MAGGPRPSEEAVYRIKLRGHLDRAWADSFTDLALTHAFETDGSPVTILRGPVRDDAALHGYLAHIRDLGIPLVLVEREP
jgi:hypothetical protein